MKTFKCLYCHFGTNLGYCSIAFFADFCCKKTDILFSSEIKNNTTNKLYTLKALCFKKLNKVILDSSRLSSLTFTFDSRYLY